MDVLVPKENNNDTVVMITKIFGGSGSYIEKGDDLIEFETSKTAVVLEAPISGYVTFLFEIDDEVEVNSVVCKIDANASAGAGKIKESEESEESLSAKSLEKDINFSNKAKKADLNNFDLSGKHWITAKMLSKNQLDSDLISNEQKGPSRATFVTAQPTAHGITDDIFSEEKTSMRKRAEISSLAISGGGAFQSTIGIEIHAGRRSVSSFLFDNSIQDIVCYESSKMLGNEFADLNAFYLSDTKVGKYKEVSAGISMDNLNRLTVGRVKSSDQKSLSSIQDELGLLFTKFEDGNLSSDDLLPSTFTITDLSSTKATYVRPLLNGAEALILGIVRKDPQRFGIFATFDHRVSEGLRIAHFLENLKARLESYFVNSFSEQIQKCGFCLKTLQEEIEEGNKGLLNISTQNGQKYICRNCYEAW